MTAYEELGLVSPKNWLKEAYEENYIIPAFNFVYMEQLLAIADACAIEQSPVFLQCSAGTRRNLHPNVIRRMVQGAIEMCASQGRPLMAGLHLDHGLTYDECCACVDEGFSSVMIDGSMLPFEDNIALVKKVVDYAHQRAVMVEAELGSLKGQEEEGMVGGVHCFTDPDQVQEFVERTDVDMLAISVGSCHGVVKIQPNTDGSLPPLRRDIINDIAKRLPGFPLVLHGASNLPKTYVDMINEFGGDLQHVQGIPVGEVARLRDSAVCKVNNASDGWIASVATARRVLSQNRETIDPRTFLIEARKEMTKLYADKVAHLFLSAHHCIVDADAKSSF